MTSPAPVTAPLRGALHAMPIIVLNMGAEMVFILDQRLRAQNISPEKGKKVLMDVIKTMFSQKFISELFRPQDVYTNRATRQVFDRLAHSSIMRLNKTSMDKLYDLMSMGFKYQVLRATQPGDLVQITLQHCQQLKEVLVGTPAAAAAAGSGNSSDLSVYESTVALIETTVKQLLATYTVLPLCELFRLKSSVFRFLQDRKVKVSVFLQEGLQNPDGTIQLHTDSAPLPVGTEPPGLVRYFHAGENTASSSDTLRPLCTAALPTPMPAAATASLVHGQPSATAMSLLLARVTSPSDSLAQLSENKYAKERYRNGNSKTAASSTCGSVEGEGDIRPADEQEDASAPAAEAVATAPVPSNSGAASASSGGSATGNGALGVNLLAAIVGVSSPAPDENFKLALFAEDGGAAGGSGALRFRAEGDASSRMAAMAAELGLDVAGSSATAGGEEEEDLLGLMDSLGQ